MKATKKHLYMSAVSLMLCAVMLLGTTFAWFTDSVTNTGNVIQAGNLDINATGFSWNAEEGKWDYPNYGLRSPLITQTKWEPGQYNAVVIKVSNYGATLAADVDIDFSITENEKNLADALWYKLTPIGAEDGVISAHVNTAVPKSKLSFVDPQNRPASEADGVITMSKIEDDATEPQRVYTDYHQGQYAYYLLEYGMYTSAGNEYMGGSFNMTVTVKAKQATVEEDGFGNSDYDADAAYGVTVGADTDSVIDAAKALKDGENLILSADVTLPAGTPRKAIRFDNPITGSVDFGGHTVTGYNGNISLVATNGSNITLSNGTLTAGSGTYCTIGADGGNITVDGLTLKNYTANGNSVKVWPNAVVNLNNVTSISNKGGAIEVTGGEVNVNGGTYTQTTYYNWNSGIGAVSNGGVLNIRDMTAVSENYCLYTFTSGGTINVYSGSFTATGNNGGKGIAIQIDGQENKQPSVVNVYGGTFDGKINVGAKNASLNITSGTFKNTGMTLEQFSKYVVDGSTVTEVDGAYVVTAA